jgi:hypothetical protein
LLYAEAALGIALRGSIHPSYTEPGIRFGNTLFSEPVSLAFAELPNVAGIYAILRFDPVWQPKPYVPILFGDAANLAEAVDAEKQRWPEGGRQIFVAWCPLLYGNALARRTLRQRLSEGYRLAAAEAPVTVDIIPAQGETTDDRIAKLESRFDHQADQIKIVMRALACAIEPQPVKPSRPIGFVNSK